MDVRQPSKPARGSEERNEQRELPTSCLQTFWVIRPSVVGLFARRPTVHVVDAKHLLRTRTKTASEQKSLEAPNPTEATPNSYHVNVFRSAAGAVSFRAKVRNATSKRHDNDKEISDTRQSTDERTGWWSEQKRHTHTEITPAPM
jgi:hypothetical protein